MTLKIVHEICVTIGTVAFLIAMAYIWKEANK